MIETQHPKLSVRRQCELVGVNRNRLAPRETKATREDHEIMKTLDQLHTVGRCHTVIVPKPSYSEG